MGANLICCYFCSPTGDKEAVYSWCRDVDEEISGLASWHPLVNLQVEQFYWHLVSKSDPEFSLNGINVINYWILISIFRVEENLSLEEVSSWTMKVLFHLPLPADLLWQNSQLKGLGSIWGKIAETSDAIGSVQRVRCVV